MFGRQRRAAVREQAEREARAQAEADALFAEADRLADLTGQPDGYRQEITAERAARIRAQLGADLVIGDADQLAAVPELQDAERGAQIDRLTEQYPEPGEAADYYRPAYGCYEPDWIPPPDDVSPAAWDRYVTSMPGSDEHKAAYAAMHQDAEGKGFPGPDPDQSYLADHESEAEADRWLTPEHIENGAEPDDAYRPDEPGSDAARWGPELHAADYYRSSPGSDEHRAAYREAFTEAGGAGYALPDDMDLSYEIDNAEELAAGRYDEELAERHCRELGEHEGEAAGERERAEANWRERDELTEPAQAPGDEPGPDAAQWTPGQDRDEAVVAEELLSEHVASAEDAWRRERRATAGEHLAELAHYEQALGRAREDAEMARAARAARTAAAYMAAADMQRSAIGPELDDAGGRSPLPRVLETSPATLAPVAATSSDGTPHADPVLAGCGWQAHGGVYVLQPQAQLEAG